MTIFVNEQMMGDEATAAEAARMIELLKQRGYAVEYGDTAKGQDQISDCVWNECLEIVGLESMENEDTE